MSIRAAVPADVTRLAEVAVAAYADAFAVILEPNALRLRDEAFFAAHFHDALDRLRVAERNGQVAGFSLVSLPHLDMLFVEPVHAGAGVGRALLEDAQQQGISTLECFAANHPARRFYERYGWRLARAYEREFLGKRRAFVFYERP